MKIRSNLTKDEKRALKESRKDDKLRAHEFDKGCGLAIVTDKKTKNRRTRQSNKIKNRPNK